MYMIITSRILYTSEATSVTLRGSHMPSVKPTFNTAECDAVTMSAAYTHAPPPKLNVTLLDLYKALQVTGVCTIYIV